MGISGYLFTLSSNAATIFKHPDHRWKTVVGAHESAGAMAFKKMIGSVGRSR